MVLGLLCAVSTSLCYGAGTVLQAVAARRTARLTSLDPGLLLRLVRDPPYLVSLGLEGVGFLASVVALRSLPLFLVEAAVASSVGVTAVLAVRFLGARLRRPDLLAFAGLALGLVLLAISAEPGSGVPLGVGAEWALLGGVGATSALGAVAARANQSWGGLALAALAGAAFGGTGVAARVLVLPDPLWRLGGDPVAWALLGYGVLGMLLFALSLQRGAVTATAAMTVCVETLLPAWLGLAYLGDAVRAGFELVAVAAFAVTLGGAVLLARFAEPEPGVAVRPDAQSAAAPGLDGGRFGA